jgi:hypothetical protein
MSRVQRNADVSWLELPTDGYTVKHIYIYIYIYIYLINALPGNSSVNTVQHPKIEEAVFTVSAATSRSGGWWSRDMCFP